MSMGFRKSLFGFNCDDVVAYIEKTHKAHAEKEIVFKEQIEDLSDENASLKEQLGEIAAEKAQLEAQLKEFTDKYDEIERLSQNIGKLYLVAQSGAQTVVKEAEASAEAARKEMLKNLAAITDAQEALSGIKEGMVNTSANFSKDVDALAKSLSEARDIIDGHEAAAAKSEKEYRELVKVLSDE